MLRDDFIHYTAMVVGLIFLAPSLFLGMLLLAAYLVVVFGNLDR